MHDINNTDNYNFTQRDSNTIDHAHTKTTSTHAHLGRVFRSKFEVTFFVTFEVQGGLGPEHPGRHQEADVLERVRSVTGEFVVGDDMQRVDGDLKGRPLDAVDRFRGDNRDGIARPGETARSTQFKAVSLVECISAQTIVTV